MCVCVCLCVHGACASIYVNMYDVHVKCVKVQRRIKKEKKSIEDGAW